MNFDEYVSAFQEVERDFENSVAEFGLEFEPQESSVRSNRNMIAQKTHFHLENNDSSLWSNWLSPACMACRTGEKTATFFVDLRCTKNCYFCFNPNQDHYEYFLHHTRDIVVELEQAHAQGVQFDCLAITGGEPLLHADHVVAFIQRARELYPLAHIRLYTSGDLLDEGLLIRLAKAGLTEIRFSIKPSDVDTDSESVYALIKIAVQHITYVMLEVPVIPGELNEMKDMMKRADKLGVKCINLLEMCFPFCSAQAFRDRGFKLRKHPFNVLYNYWYGGGIPVAESERVALELVEFAYDENLSMSVHYCSSDNKNTGQIYQQDHMFEYDETLRNVYSWMQLDTTDWFIKCAKVFGSDVNLVMLYLLGEDSTAFSLDDDLEMLSFPLAYAQEVRKRYPLIRIGESFNVLEQDEAGVTFLKEIWVREY